MLVLISPLGGVEKIMFQVKLNPSLSVEMRSFRVELSEHWEQRVSAAAAAEGTGHTHQEAGAHFESLRNPRDPVDAFSRKSGFLSFTIQDYGGPSFQD